MSRLENKIAMLTGAASGIGKASAKKMASLGATVVITDLNRDAAQAAADEIVADGGKAFAYACDIGDENSISAAIDYVVSTHGRLDVLHNNAAYTAMDALEQDVDILSIPTEMWDKIMQITLRGTMLGCRYGVKAMRKSGGGSIINTSSMYGVSAFVRQPAYGVSKGAINHLTEYVATAYGRENIRCNAIAPSMVKTPLLLSFIPEELIKLNEDAALTPSLPEPEDIANIVAFLASDESKYLTGQVIRADGGSTAHLATCNDANNFFNKA